MSWRSVVLGGVLAGTVIGAACSRDPELARQDYLRRGDEYVAQKKFHEAAVEYSNALKLDPNDGKAEVALANAYHEIGDYVHAAGSLARAADLLPDDLDLQLRAGSMRLLARKYEDAKALADKVIAKQPTNLVALLLRANALAGLDDVDTAVRQIEEAIALDPERAEFYTNLGTIQAARGRTELAEEAFKQAIAVAPRDPRAYAGLANYYWEARRLSDAERTFLLALELDPAYLPGNRTLATFYLATGRPQLAERFLKAVADGSKDVAARLRLADYYTLYGKRDVGIQLLNELAKLPDGFAPATTRLAARAFADGNRDEGHRLVTQVLSGNPRDARAQQLLAHFLFTENKVDEALLRARQAIQADSRLESAHYLMARIHLAQGNVQDAIGELKAVVQLNPRAANAQILLAQLQADAGYPDLAVSLATQAVSSAGGAPAVRLGLVRVLFAKGDLARAGMELTSLRKEYPKTLAVLTTTGDYHLLKKEYAAARAAFDTALTQEPGSIEAITGLVAVDLLSGKPEAGRKRVEAELARTPERTGLLLLAAKTYGALRDFPRAEAMMKKAIATNPASIEGYGMLGQFLYQQGRLEEGRREFETLTQKQPRNVSALTMLAIIVNRQGKTEEAIGRYEAILVIDNDAPVAANNLAWIFADTGRQLDRAIQLAQIAADRLPNEPGVVDTLGWAFVKRGMASLGLPHLLASVGKRPQEATFRYHLGAAYAQVKDPLKARAELQEALRLSSSFANAADARRLLDSLK